MTKNLTGANEIIAIGFPKLTIKKCSRSRNVPMIHIDIRQNWTRLHWQRHHLREEWVDPM